MDLRTCHSRPRPTVSVLLVGVECRHTSSAESDTNFCMLLPQFCLFFTPKLFTLRSTLITGLRKYLKLKRDDEETLILKRRVGPFLVDNEKRKELSIHIGCRAIDDEDHDYCRVFELPRSGKNGHFEALISISDEELETVCTCDHHKETSDNNGVMTNCQGKDGSAILKYQAVTEEDDDRKFKGVSHLIPPTGISVISDIDDTVKITGVGNKRALLRSTFMEEFKEVPGMSQLYRQWATDLDAKFHFVSSSPWQLWEELAQFFDKVGFPDATFHLKPVRIKDRTLFDLWKCPIETKTSVLESILKAFPERKFLLVGDSGEKDPEVYGEIARRYPTQVQGIYIRNVTDETGKEERFNLAFEGVDPDVWALFKEPEAIRLPKHLLEPESLEA